MRRYTVLHGTASICIILVVLHLGRAIVIPFLLGLLVAIGASGVFRLTEIGVPRWLSVALACAAAVGVCVGLGALFTFALQELVSEWPMYERGWEDLRREAVRWFSRHSLGDPALAVRELEPADAAMEYALPGLAVAARVTSNFFFVLLIAVFLLIEAAVVQVKFDRVKSIGGIETAIWRRTSVEVQRYLWIKTLTSVVTGLMAGALTWAAGLEHPLLFGLLAFILNYIPTVGSLVAMVPAVVIGVLTLGWSTGLVLIAGYGVINVGIGLILEPRWLGSAIGLSPSIVFLSMAFWAFVLGPVGALLSVPLMMIVRIAAGQSPHWTWLATLLAAPREVLKKPAVTESA
ncbi:MAG: AI-2E family transporter [Polyangiales bacterium]